jgi:nucleoid-associated protein YgaU|tara:strand:- start:2208 stop:2549 length:342 start_codon:yes stop_codon:yes gene_type:complete
MSIRYDNRRAIVNEEEVYEDLRESRDLKKIKHYATPRIPHLTKQKRLKLTRIRHTWKTGDKYWSLASKHYGDPSLWWLIAWYNQKPTEAHIKMGDVIIVPKPLDKILHYYYRE